MSVDVVIMFFHASNVKYVMIENGSLLVNIVKYHTTIVGVLRQYLSERCGPGTLTSVMFRFRATQSPTISQERTHHTRIGLRYRVIVVVDKA